MADSRIRVLWLIKGLGPGGAENLLVNHAGVRDSIAFEYEAAYLVPEKAHLVPELEALGVAVSALDSHSEWDPRWALRLRRRLKAHPVDLIHGHSPYVAAVTRLIVATMRREVRPALVYTEHNRWPRHRRVTRLANRLTFGLEDAHIAVSAAVRDTIPKRLRDRVEVIVHGVDITAVRQRLSDRDEVRAELGIREDEVVIGIVANYRPEKGYDVLLEAASVLFTRAASEDSPIQRTRFVVVGQGPLEAEIREKHRDLHLGDRVLLLGYRPDAVRVMSAFDVFTLSSRHEGLPVSLMDALVLGIPVVATDVGGIPEAVTNGVEGRLVPSEDPACLAEAYAEILEDAPLRSRFGAASIQRGHDFDITTAARAIERRYRIALEVRDAKRL